MGLGAILTLGFLLGMRHATDADHVVAVTTIVSRQRSLRAAVPVGLLWGTGHSVTLLLVGGAIILLGVVVPPRLGLGMELAVAVVLVVLGTVNVRGVLRERASVGAHLHEHGDHGPAEGEPAPTSKRPLLVGIVHGLAGSAAAALLVLGTMSEPLAAMAYLLVFSLGTVGGMLLVTTAFAVPIAVAAGRFHRLHRWLGVATGLGSVAFGMALVYEIGIVHGLFTSSPDWTPR